jgi:3-hydroxyacyl-[acyl-carrier-protein] dehydratase
MRFCQLDRIRELVPGQKVVAVKSLTLAETYLKDHFPRFPVMPGVLMLEAMFQAGMWLIYATNQFSRSTVVLSEARQVRFTDFVQPGNQLVVTTEWGSVEGDSHSMQASATIGDSIAVRARLTLDYYNLADRSLASPAIDKYLVKERVEQFRRLQDPRNPFNLSFTYATDTDPSIVS